jgi:hypothetical protein
MPEDEVKALAKRAGKRVLSQHTARHRAEELEYLVHDLQVRGSG